MKKAIQTDQAPKAIGPYSQAIDTGDWVFVSGQLGLDPETGTLKEGIEAQTRQALENIGAVLRAAGLDYTDVVKTTIFLAQMSDFKTVNGIYVEYFSAPYPARATVAVKELPLNALVEIEVIARRR